MTLTLLVDGPEYWARARQDLAGAKQRILVQAMSFEGDRAGLGMARLLRESAAADRRVVVDYFTRWVINDHFVWKPSHLFDRELGREITATRRMFEELLAAGVGVEFRNPMGPIFVRGPARNHKKLVAVDDRVAYIGGINLTDHNFAWRDMMLRIEDADVAGFLREDFEATWRGDNRAERLNRPGIEIHSLDGADNPRVFDRVRDLIDAAQHSIQVENAYLTPPFVGWLEAAASRGVEVTILTPRDHNWRLPQHHVIWRAAVTGMKVRLFEGRMNHTKAMLVDGRQLVMGSANFDLWSYWFQQEYLVIVSEEALIADYRRRVLEPDLAVSSPCDIHVSAARGRSAARKLWLFERASLFFNRKGRGRDVASPLATRA
jgi:cardiolipin synthase